MTNLTTKLSAVNEMMSVIGESAIITLDNIGLTVAADAKKQLDTTSRQVQIQGWRFNTDENKALVRNVDGYILLPISTLDFKVCGQSSHLDLTERAGKVYNRVEQTFVFTETVYCDVIKLLDFEDLPETARYYITIKAARIFQDRYLGEEDRHIYNRQDEAEAIAVFKKSHTLKSRSTFVSNELRDINRFR